MYHLGSWRPQTPINKLMDMVFGIFNSIDSVQGATLVAQMVKNPPAKQMCVRSLGWEDPLEKGIATHSSILAYRISQRVAWWAIVHGITNSRARLND